MSKALTLFRILLFDVQTKKNAFITLLAESSKTVVDKPYFTTGLLSHSKKSKMVKSHLGLIR